MKPLFTLLSLIIFMTPAWADLHKFDLPLNTPSYDVSFIVEASDSDVEVLEMSKDKNSKEE